MESNIYYISILIILFLFFNLDIISTLLNLSAMKEELPQDFVGSYDKEKYKKSQKYTKDNARLSIIESVFDLAILLLFWQLGGFQWLDNYTRSFGLNPIFTGLLFIVVLTFGKQILGLPFSIYNTFVIEERYGFNKTTIKTFIVDLIKVNVLSIVIGLPIVACILYIFNQYDNAWLYSWVTLTVFSLGMTYIAPKFIMPLFNKFEPLEDGELKDEINVMAKKCDFPLTEIFIMDGSKRSSKSNAFFTGFGKNKKIALFDTLVKNHTVKELVSILAHEIGHFKKKHIHKSIALSILQTGFIFFLLNFFLKSEGLFKAFGTQPSTYCGFIFFSLLFIPISRILSVLMSVFSRKNEFEADEFAVKLMNEPDSLINALKKLSVDNLSNLTPHKFYVFLNYSHPTVIERIKAMKAVKVS